MHACKTAWSLWWLAPHALKKGPAICTFWSHHAVFLAEHRILAATGETNSQSSYECNAECNLHAEALQPSFRTCIAYDDRHLREWHTGASQKSQTAPKKANPAVGQQTGVWQRCLDCHEEARDLQPCKIQQLYLILSPKPGCIPVALFPA